MIEDIETVMLHVLPWSFVLKSTAMLIMWWSLQFNTKAVGPLGRRINTSFRDQLVMSIITTVIMFIIGSRSDASRIDWPFVSISLILVAIWPLRSAWSHYRVWSTYRNIARARDQNQ